MSAKDSTVYSVAYVRKLGIDPVSLFLAVAAFNPNASVVDSTFKTVVESAYFPRIHCIHLSQFSFPPKVDLGYRLDLDIKTPKLFF